MDSLLTPPVQSAKKRWPEVPAVRGEHYGAMDPNFQGNRIIIMSHDTWEDLGTYIEALKRKAAAGEKAAAQLQATNQVLTDQMSKLQTRFDNLKASERARRRGEAGKLFDLTK